MVEKRPPPAAEIEYSIYTFDMPGGGKGETQWERQSVMNDMAAAMAQAQSLLDSGKYQKVEVKKKFFDQKKNRNIDMSLQVLETKVKKDYSIPIFLILALLAGGGAFAAAFFLTQ